MATKVSAVRVRWTGDEAAKVVQRAHALRARHPNRSMRDLAEAAQDVLPATRRRPVHAPLVSWMNKRVRDHFHAEAIAKLTPPRRPLRDMELAQPLIEAGAAIVVGVLNSPAVREAFRSLFAAHLTRQRRAR